MYTQIDKGTKDKYQAFLVVAWETTRKYEEVQCRDETRYENVETTTPKLFSCNTTEELVSIVDSLKVRGWPFDILKTTKVTLKQTVTLDIDE